MAKIYRDLEEETAGLTFDSTVVSRSAGGEVALKHFISTSNEEAAILYHFDKK